MGGKTWEKLRSNLGETGEKPEGEEKNKERITTGAEWP